MNTILKKILRLYNFFLTTSLIVYGVVSASNLGGFILVSFFIGIEVYFLASYFNKKSKLITAFLSISTLASWITLILIILNLKSIISFFTIIFFIPLVLDLTTNFLGIIKKSKAVTVNTRVEEGLVVDDDFQIERRKIIKMFAGTTAGALLLYLINPKKANAAFFGSIPGPGTVAIKDSLGSVVDPSIKNPTDSYGIADVDEATSTHYYGFIHYNNTDWYIFKESPSGACTYASKVNNDLVTYSTGWANRATTLIFGTYAEAF